MDKATIQTKANGPYLVQGPFRIVDPDGNEFRVDRETVALCRCGGSKNKPFCDGAHSKAGFQSAEKAPKS